ncbi:MAG: DUF1285 domain-containing protein [Parvularcula sp.]
MRPIFFVSDFLHMAASLADVDDGAPPPVESWHPDHCGTMDLVIRSDGSWIHEGTPIGRPRLVRLLSRILRHDPDGYVLVTPVEKISIKVEDVPFLIVDADHDGDVLSVRTNVGDRVDVGPEHPLVMREGPGGDMVAYVKIRGGLLARFGRSAWYRLVDAAGHDDTRGVTIKSNGEIYCLCNEGAA